MRHLVFGWAMALSHATAAIAVLAFVRPIRNQSARYRLQAKQQSQQQRDQNHNHPIESSAPDLHTSQQQPQPQPQPQPRIIEDGQRRLLLQRTVSSLSSSATALLLVTASSSATTTTANAENTATFKDALLVPHPPYNKDWTWPLGKVAFSLLPLSGTWSNQRATLQEEIAADTIWTHDQIQGIVNVNVPVRQTVVRLSDQAGGGLWVHNPVAPTPQLLQMMQALVQRYGPVRHIVLGTVALEHKATLASFAAHFPQATVWLQPGQWSFPLSVPVELYGLVQRGPRLRELPVGIPSSNRENLAPYSNATATPRYSYYAQRDPIPEWTADIEYEVLGPLYFRSVGAFSETAFYHRPTRTLVVTDTVASVTKDPPPIIALDPRALLYHARDSIRDTTIQDTTETRRKGWRRMVQFGLCFFPSQITVTPSLGQALAEARSVPRRLRNLGRDAVPGLDGTLYPWTWAPNDADEQNFNAIAANGKLFCPPILTKLILDREPAATLDFCNRVCRRFGDMQRIIPGHLNNNVRLHRGTKDFYEAFDPLRSTPGNLMPQRALAEDLALLQAASDLLTRYGIVAPSQVCDGEPARQKGRFAKA
jgi:Domain of unknown function (DUF4336)